MFAFACLACLLSVGHGAGFHVSPQVEQKHVDGFANLLLMLHPAGARSRAQSIVPAATVRRTQPLVDMKASMDLIKELRERSGAGVGDCKKALEENDLDVQKGFEWLKKQGVLKASKKAGRSAKEGLIETYVHTGGTLGVMVEVNCETDFLAKNDKFKQFAKEIALQIASCPEITAVSEEDIDPAFLAETRKRESESDDLKGKPADIIEKIVEGRVSKIVGENLLMTQPFLMDNSITVEDHVKGAIATMGENIKVARFTRFTLGGSQ